MKDSFFKEIGALLDIIIDDGPEFPAIHTENEVCIWVLCINGK